MKTFILTALILAPIGAWAQEINCVAGCLPLHVRCGGPDIGDSCVMEDSKGNKWTCGADGNCPSEGKAANAQVLSELYSAVTGSIPPLSPRCEPGWTLVTVATQSGSVPKCAAVGDLRDPK